MLKIFKIFETFYFLFFGFEVGLAFLAGGRSFANSNTII